MVAQFLGLEGRDQLHVGAVQRELVDQARQRPSTTTMRNRNPETDPGGSRFCYSYPGVIILGWSAWGLTYKTIKAGGDLSRLNRQLFTMKLGSENNSFVVPGCLGEQMNQSPDEAVRIYTSLGGRGALIKIPLPYARLSSWEVADFQSGLSDVLARDTL
ncbi:hypothetical protein NM208_g12804 [Fusarium decemcellulare]|uniref:Uncharacterized protein n=1 Tax=Fusarium decemcellulare TaxID=57161 RepID=A0ACC1RM71_9HYPO|nr:hypothetical protein NM208_g12804 [Fusarium decemcellulare]